MTTQSARITALQALSGMTRTAGPVRFELMEERDIGLFLGEGEEPIGRGDTAQEAIIDAMENLDRRENTED